jgi:hypothetical protein
MEKIKGNTDASTLRAIVSAVRATVNKTAALGAAIKARWATQDDVTGTDYRKVTDAAKTAYTAAGGSEGGFHGAWSAAMAVAGLLPVTKDGKPMQKKGKVGAKQTKGKATQAAPAKSPVSKEQAIRALFGSFDPELLAAVEYAVAHTVTFTAWATASAAAAEKLRVRAKFTRAPKTDEKKAA